MQQARPILRIIAAGGRATGYFTQCLPRIYFSLGALYFLVAGASAVQVGTATFADPHAPGRVLRDLSRWCRDHGVDRLADLVGAAHAEGSP